MRVLIVAHPLSAAAIRRHLRSAAVHELIEGYADGRRPCSEIVARERPDVVVVDEMGAPLSALARVREIRTTVPNAKVVLLSDRMAPEWLAEASAAGVHAAVAKQLRADTWRRFGKSYETQSVLPTREWLDALPDDPGRYLKLRLSAEQARRLARGSSREDTR